MTVILVLLACIVPSCYGFSVIRSKIPEEVIQHQLDLLQKYKVQQAFQYNSENNQAVTGPWKSYAASLAEGPFRSILGHAESSVVMTISHDEGDYVCCLVKVVPGKDPLPDDLSKVIQQGKALDGIEDNDNDDEDEDNEEDAEEEDSMSSARRQRMPCLLYWWEVSKQLEDDDDDGDNFYYLVDSLLPDAEDLELDYMETTLFAIGDEDDDEDEDDLSGYFFDLS